MPENLIYQHIKKKAGQLVHDENICITPVRGGCINDCFRIDTAHESFFCKVNSATEFPQLFEREKEGLQLIGAQHIIRVPKVIDCFYEGAYQFLLMEWITEGVKTDQFWKNAGAQLAAMHQVSSRRFGLATDNYMGSVPQMNQLSDHWVDFFIRCRLQPLIQQCSESQLLPTGLHAKFETLFSILPPIFDDAKPVLVHGDLWSGNILCDDAGQPVLIDPAVYFGHPSVDLGMTTLFGGFPGSFYDAYQHHALLPPNHQEQWQVCNLYPLLIHLYLFGSSYLSQIQQTLRRFT